jgi:hypothetical protein
MIAGAVVLVVAFNQDQTVGEATALGIAAVWLYTFWQYRRH